MIEVLKKIAQVVLAVFLGGIGVGIILLMFRLPFPFVITMLLQQFFLIVYGGSITFAFYIPRLVKRVFLGIFALGLLLFPNLVGLIGNFG